MSELLFRHSASIFRKHIFKLQTFFALQARVRYVTSHRHRLYYYSYDCVRNSWHTHVNEQFLAVATHASTYMASISIRLDYAASAREHEHYYETAARFYLNYIISVKQCALTSAKGRKKISTRASIKLHT